MAERWFIIKHEECGSVFTINSDRFAEGMNSETRDEKMLFCPSCRSPLIFASDIQTFLIQYGKLTEKLAELKSSAHGKLKGYTIREIKSKIDPEKLEL
jgi:hypothetical protein